MLLISNKKSSAHKGARSSQNLNYNTHTTMTHTNNPALPSDINSDLSSTLHVNLSQFAEDTFDKLEFFDDTELDDSRLEDIEYAEAPDLETSIAQTGVARLFIEETKAPEPELFGVPISFIKDLDPNIIELYTQLFNIMGEDAFMAAYRPRVNKIQQSYEESLQDERMAVARKERITTFAQNLANTTQSLDGIASLLDSDENIVAAAGQLHNPIVQSMLVANHARSSRDTLRTVKGSAALLQEETRINAALQLAQVAISKKAHALKALPEHADGFWAWEEGTDIADLRTLAKSWAIFQLRVLQWQAVDFPRFDEFAKLTNSQFVERQIAKEKGTKYLTEPQETNLRLQVLDKIQAQEKDEFGFYAGAQPQPRPTGGQQPASGRNRSQQVAPTTFNRSSGISTNW